VEILKGQKITLDENFLTVNFVRDTDSLEIDTAAFLQSGNEKVADDDFIFYGNPQHNSGGVIHREDFMEIDLSKIPQRIEKISFTATIYDAEKRKQNFSQVKNASLKIKNSRGDEIASFRLENFSVETAIVLGEIYRYKGKWKFNATGAGFSGGLAALCKNFGIEVKEEISAPTQKIAPTPPPPQPKKIELRKAQKVNLTKQKNSSLGEVVINLNWNQKIASKGFFGFNRSRNIDLDLCCLYELKNGAKGAIQALGERFGSLEYAPYIMLDGDDRTGSNASGETIRINGKFINKIKRVLIYTFIYEGAANWSEAQGVVSVKCPNNPEIVVRMDEYGSTLNTCAIALLENVGETFSIEKVVDFYLSSEEMDRAFNWGLRWQVGYKD